MWGAISTAIDLVGLVIMIVLWVRMLTARDRAGAKAFSRTPLAELGREDRRRLMRAIRHGDAVPAEHRDVALHWARQEVLRRGVFWIMIVIGVETACSLPSDLVNSEWLSVAAFWLAIVALCALVPGAVYVRRDQLAALRLLRDTSPPA